MRPALLLAVLACQAPGDWAESLGGRLERNARGDVVAVDLRGSFVSDADLGQLARLEHLERIDLSLTRVTDLGLLRLKHLRNVGELNLLFAELITDEGLAVIKDWPRIQRLNLRGTKVTDNTLAILAGKDTIAALDIGYAEVTDSGLQHLPQLKGLRELSFGGNKMTDVGMQVLRSLPGLTKLDVAGKQRTDSGLWSVAVTDLALEPVATLAELRELNLAGTQVTARGLETLGRLKKLEKLNLYGAKRVGDDAVTRLASMPALRWVDLGDTAVTHRGFDELAKTNRIEALGRPAAPILETRVILENEFLRVIRGVDAATQGTVVVVDLYPPVYVEFKHWPRREVRYPKTTLTAAEGFRKVVHEDERLRVTRLACESRRSCPPNDHPAMDVRLSGEARQIGDTMLLTAGAAARFNEAPEPLELTRIEWKTDPGAK
jgi:Leucine-rich repeat (LRR) protein